MISRVTTSFITSSSINFGNTHSIQVTAPSSSTVPSSIAALSLPSASFTKKKKTKSGADDLDATLLKRELAAAQTRICQLDATIEEKDKRVAVLLSRIKILEERENASTYDKYFPSNRQAYSHPLNSSDCPSQHHMCFNSNTHCMAARPNCSCHVSNPSPCQNHYDACSHVTIFRELKQSMSQIHSMIENLLNSKASSSNFSETAPAQTVAHTSQPENQENHTLQYPTFDADVECLDVSRASIDSFMSTESSLN